MGHNWAMLPLLSAQQQILVRSENTVFLSAWLTFIHLVACVWLVTFGSSATKKKRLTRGEE